VRKLNTMPKIQTEDEKKQKELTTARDVLFRRLLQSPQEIHLALEIKAIDDKIAVLRSRK
jgi:hypothetical protein